MWLRQEVQALLRDLKALELLEGEFSFPSSSVLRIAAISINKGEHAHKKRKLVERDTLTRILNADTERSAVES